LRFDVRHLHEAFEYSSANVTNDKAEAMTMADRIVIMNAGRIEQIGTPEDVYERPNSAFVARFIGGSNVLRVTHGAQDTVKIGGHMLQIGQGEFSGPGQLMHLCVKTHDLELMPVSSAGARG